MHVGAVWSRGPRECYIQNLIRILEASTPLIDDLISPGLEGVITSGHGEFLRERWSYGHWPGSKRPILRLVPLFRVNRVKKVFRSLKYRLVKGLVEKEHMKHALGE